MTRFTTGVYDHHVACIPTLVVHVLRQLEKRATDQ